MSQRLKAVKGAPITDVVAPGPATFTMVEKVALLNLDRLIQANPTAARLITSLIRLMEPGSSGVVVISRQAMTEILGCSMPTVDRCLKILIEGRWVHRVKVGGASALAINKTVAWCGPRGDMSHAIFSATVIAARSEQDEHGLNPGELQKLPIAHPGEEVLAVGRDPDPPFQQTLEGVLPAVALTGMEPDLP